MGKKRRSGFANDDEEDEVIMGFESVYMWCDPMVSGPVFGSVLVVLLSICYYSFLSVVAYTALFALGGCVGVKLYVYVMNTFLKKNINDPLAKYAGMDPTIPEDRISEFSNCFSGRVNTLILDLRRLFLVDDIVESVKFGLALWFLTYLGSWMNFMTMVILAWVGLFTIPKIYGNNRQTLDPILDQVKGHLNDVCGKVSAFLPKKKVAEEAKKDD